MPFLSWTDEGGPRRLEVDAAVRIGRDPLKCDVSFPQDPALSRDHALIAKVGGSWWIRDLDSRNGTLVNGLPVTTPIGSALQDGDEILMGERRLHFSDSFPGLDGVDHVEGVGDLFSEARPEPGQAMVLLRALELLHRASESLLQEGSSQVMFRSILAEALRLMGADRGFIVMVDADGSWQGLHRVGDVEDQQGLSRTVVAYVLKHRTAVLSNAPLTDPRFGGASLVELHCGAVMCAPMELAGEIKGVLYLDRARKGRPFARFDLAMLQAFVRQGAVALRHTELVQGAMRQAEVQGEYLRLRALHDRTVRRAGELLGAMRSSLRWIEAYAESGYGDPASALRHQAGRLHALVESGLQETVLEMPQDTPAASGLQELQEAVETPWRDLLRVRKAELTLEAVPPGTVWMAGEGAASAIMGLVEPLLMRVPEGSGVMGRWLDQATAWTLRLQFGGGMPMPVPDPWTVRALRESGIRWHWNDQMLSLDFPKDAGHTPGFLPSPALGLVCAGGDLVGLFEGVAAAEGLSFQLLEAEPPRTQLPGFRYLVVDAKYAPDPVGCVDAYRRHPSFATVPILVVRSRDDQFPELLAAGTTDCLPEGFRWETLHHRLQVLRGHDELQRKARAAERLDSLRQMAGTLKHEINNPLAVISMQIELLARKYPEEPKLQKVMEMVERIRVLVQVLQKMREATTEDYPGGASILKLG
ncbi:MAG TPA: GAF domain-containing protein [Holophaga sp.]|nr:GAF domain-containing protein [Holophaga sp.]